MPILALVVEDPLRSVARSQARFSYWTCHIYLCVCCPSAIAGRSFQIGENSECLLDGDLDEAAGSRLAVALLNCE